MSGHISQAFVNKLTLITTCAKFVESSVKTKNISAEFLILTLFKLSVSEAIHIARSRRGLFLHWLSIYLCPQNILASTIRDLEMLESSGFHQNVDLSSLLSKFISDFENPFRKTSERKNSQFSVIFFLDTVIYRH